jgi:hypothetical protein
VFFFWGGEPDGCVMWHVTCVCDLYVLVCAWWVALYGGSAYPLSPTCVHLASTATWSLSAPPSTRWARHQPLLSGHPHLPPPTHACIQVDNAVGLVTTYAQAVRAGTNALEGQVRCPCPTLPSCRALCPADPVTVRRGPCECLGNVPLVLPLS